MFGDGNHIIDYGRNMFKIDAEHWMALQAIHGAVHAAKIGLKYTWFGPGYISNMYFKVICTTGYLKCVQQNSLTHSTKLNKKFKEKVKFQN